MSLSPSLNQTGKNAAGELGLLQQFRCRLSKILVAAVLVACNSPSALAAQSICTVRVNLSQIVHDSRRSVGSADVLVDRAIYEHFSGPDYGKNAGRYVNEANQLALRLANEGRCVLRRPWWVFSSDGPAALAAHVGTYTVTQRNCWDHDKLCTSTASVVLTREGGRYRFQEIDATGHVKDKILEERIDGSLETFIFRQIKGEDSWVHYVEDASDRIVRDESVTFETDWRTGAQSIDIRTMTKQSETDITDYYRTYQVEQQN